MSGPKVDVHWSPVDDDIFMTYGTAINLFQAKERNGLFDADSDIVDAEQSTAPVITHLASYSELQFMKCVAWCPRPQPRNVFAVAQGSGRVSIIGFGNERNEDLVGKEFNVRYNRQCNYLAWNAQESNLLAEGLDRNRNEPCVLIWDVINSVNVDSNDRTRHSFSEGPVTKPYAELGSGESSASFAWCPTDSKSFVVGMANKHLRLFDLRDINKPRKETQNKCVNGICFEPLDKYRIASYVDSLIAIWDLRNFDRPVNLIKENKNIVKLSWCPTKLGILSVLCKDSPIVKLHDIRHSIFGSDEIEQASVERNIQPFGKSQLSSFAWHPTQDNRLMSVLPNGSLKDTTVFDRISMEWSSSFKLMMPINKDTLRCMEEVHENGDISSVMKRRVGLGYGLQAEDVSANLRAIENEAHLHGLWRWILNLRTVIASQELSNTKHCTPASTGIVSLLGFDRNDNSIIMSSDPAIIQWKASEGAKYSGRTHYKSPQRLVALQLCGWVTDPPRDKFDSFINRLVITGEPERAAAIALFHLHIKTALEILSTCSMPSESDEGRPNLQAVAMALSGFTEDPNALWRRTCGTLRYQLENPYLRAIFAFAACDADSYDDVLNEEAMSVEDRVAFALNYLPDSKLKAYLCKLSDELTKAGDLDGILLTGMSEKGINLFENYMDRTCDVQTAAIAAVFAKSSAVLKDKRVLDWIEGYRDLLDRWRFWLQRAQFDIVHQSQIPGHRVPPQVHVSCNFCGKPVSNTQSLLSKARNLIYRTPQEGPKISCCPSCRKALPRCAICLSHMGTLSGLGGDSSGGVKVNPFKDWFTWCQTCRHGGHASHLQYWFSEHSDCPVTGCTCKCIVQDATSRRVPQALDGLQVRGDELATVQ